MVRLNLIPSPSFTDRCQAASVEALRIGYLDKLLAGAVRRGKELVAGTIQGGPGDSFAINLETGQWADFATGQKGGDLISLLAAREGCDQGQALESLERDLHLGRRSLLPPKPNRDLPKTPTSGPPSKIWVYTDADGRPLYEARRWEKAGHTKACLMHGVGGKERVPLYLPNLLAAKAEGRPVYLVEGEPKADLLWTWGLAGTSIIGGAKGWKPELAKWFAGAEVVIVVDADDPGRDFGRQAAQDLSQAKSVKVLELPAPKFAGYDLIDWAKDGGSADQLLALTADPAATKPAGKPRPLQVDVWSGSLLAALDRGPQPYDWLIKDSLRRGQLGLISGAPGCGKGMFALQLQMALTLGFPAFERWESEAPIRSLFISNEDDRVILDNRLNAIWDSLTKAEQRKDLVPNLAAVSVKGRVALGQGDKSQLTATEHFTDLKNLIAEFRPDLVFLDTLAQFGGIDENDNVLMTAYCNMLDEIIDEFKCNIVLIHHSSKTSGDLADKENVLQASLTQTAIRGASALAGAVRWALLMAQLGGDLATKIIGPPAKDKPPGTYVAARVAKKNAGPAETRIYLERGEHGLLWPVEPATAQRDEAEALEDAYQIAQEVEKRKRNMELKLSAKNGVRKHFGWSYRRASAAVDKALELGLTVLEKRGRGGGFALVSK